ncbi:MAG TPA: hypothetical protein VEP71_02480 [Gallionella sp.]|nr:hypothetical protein [Gallionella sp.]
MSRKHPIIAVSGLFGAGTPVVRQAFENLFRREVKVRATFIEGASIQKIHRDKAGRGYSTEVTVDTSNPFVACDVPMLDLPSGMMSVAMEVILAPIVHGMMENLRTCKYFADIHK